MMRTFSILFCLFFLGFAQGQTTYPAHSWKQYVDNCLIGYVDPEGKIMIEAQFENAMDFSEGLAFVWSFPGKERDMESVGLGEQYVNYESFLNDKGNRRTGIIDSTGKYVVEPKVNFRVYRAYKGGIALVVIDDKLEVIDKKGKIVSSYYPGLYEEEKKDVLLVARYDQSLPVQKCYMNAERRFVYGPFKDCHPFSDGFGAVKIGNKYGYINKAGELKIIPQFQKAGLFHNGYATVAVRLGEGSDLNIGYGVIDTNGQFVIPPEYDRLEDVREGKVAFSKIKNRERKYGYLNLKGEVIIPAKYDWTSAFYDGLAVVRLNDLLGYIDQNGKEVIPIKYERAQHFKTGAARVWLKKNKSALINKKGQIIFGPQKEKCD
ncbi:MAG: WG repeat-containing protein [Flavobacteriales bacterium]|nr:WG repeat-containing protein [Flavobacteriales bacterium]